MSFFDDASLAFLPSGGAGKDGKAYSIKPTDGTGDFTFSRGSNLTATRVGPTGLIEKGRENKLEQSNQFDTTWTLGAGLTLTSGQTGYDGSSDAWLYADTATGNSLQQNKSASGVQTLSIYAKAGTADGIRLRWLGGSGGDAYFNVADASTEAYQSTNTIATKKEDVGSGWFRVSLTFNDSVNTIRIYVGDGSTTSSVSGNIVMQDAQLEIGLAATDYIESGASTGKAGLLEDEPRFDYSGGATCPSLLLEPSRTNLFPQTEYFDSNVWSGTGNYIIEHNSTTSPEGVLNAAKFTPTTSSGSKVIFYEINITSGVDYTHSFFVKPDGYDYCYIYFSASGGAFNGDLVIFDLTGGGSINSNTANLNASIEPLTNGWFRISATDTAIASATGRIYFRTQPTPSINNYAGNGSDGIYLYGAQLEEASYPTSYIPNHSGGSATRTADLIQKLNQSSVIGQTEGTIFFDAFFKENDKVNFSLSDSTSSNHLTIDTTGANSVFGRVVASGTIQAEINTSGGFFTNGDRLKCALAYKENDFAFYINGTQIGTDTSGSVPVCDDIRFARYNGSLSAYQGVNQVLLFDTRLSNADLETLTT